MARQNDHTPVGYLRNQRDEQRRQAHQLPPTARAVRYTPTGSADENGAVGTEAFDDNYFYVKHATGWRRYTGVTF